MPPDSVRGLSDSDHDLLIRIDEKLRIVDEALKSIIQSLEALRMDHGKRITALEERALPTTEYRDYVIRAQKREADVDMLDGKIERVEKQVATIKSDLAPFLRRQEDAEDVRQKMSVGSKLTAISAMMFFLGSVILLFAQHIHVGP